MRFETLAIHAGDDHDTSGSVIPPIYVSTTYRRGADGSFAGGNNYIRDDNPNRRMLESCMAQLEGGVAAAAFASGMAATMTVFQALDPGDHVVGAGKAVLQVWEPGVLAHPGLLESEAVCDHDLVDVLLPR